MLEAIERSWASSRWAVIKDARRRQLRRRRRMFGVAALLLLAAAVGWAVASSSQAGHRPSPLSVSVGAVEQLHLGGIVQDTTTLHGHLWVLTCWQHCSQPSSIAVRGQLIELTASGRPIARFPVADPGAVTSGDGSIWLAHFHAGTVTKIDPQTGQSTATIQLKLPIPVATGDRRFIPSAISFSGDRVWVSTARGWTAEINPSTARLLRMAYSSSEATSATTAAGLTWVADELDGIGTFPATSTHVMRHQITWAGQPLSIDTVEHGVGLIWALGSDTNYAASSTNPTTTSVLTTINPRTGHILHQWRVGNTATMVLANDSAYIGDDTNGRLVHLTPPNHVQILHGPKAASLTAATPHALWATLRGRLLRIALTPH